ncbi:iron-sulfur cluster biosynthesis family protein [Priestia abyssalis]|uniref:iron-sulfur cluster biosynthesis family protein n=1 Tax=Priestia abyssalis TaxID=1221450 RepID=UPI0009958A5D|nr:iron-sulfur cluster biosynthesis family protein [Priestia abyssalis]
MNITFTDKAMEKIQLKLSDSKGKQLKLKYDTEGCGCVVSGVSALWIVSEREEDDINISTNFQPLLMEKTKQVFFDEEMTIDFVKSANSFMLKSPNQILNPRMSLVDKS